MAGLEPSESILDWSRTANHDLKQIYSEGEQEADVNDIDIEKISRTNPKPMSRANPNGRISGRKDVKPNTQKSTTKPDFKFDPRKWSKTILHYRWRLYLHKEGRDQIFIRVFVLVLLKNTDLKGFDQTKTLK